MLVLQELEPPRRFRADADKCAPSTSECDGRANVFLRFPVNLWTSLDVHRPARDKSKTFHQATYWFVPSESLYQSTLAGEDSLNTTRTAK